MENTEGGPYARINESVNDLLYRLSFRGYSVANKSELKRYVLAYSHEVMEILGIEFHEKDSLADIASKYCDDFFARACLVFNSGLFPGDYIFDKFDPREARQVARAERGRRSFDLSSIDLII